MLKHGVPGRRAESRVRARIRKRQQMRRLSILVTILIIAVSLGVGAYFLSTSGQSSKLDQYIGQPVSSSDMAALVSASGQPYGPAAPATMQGVLQKYSGVPFISGGKPTFVYIGGDFCPYCAVDRWAIVLALMRFGTFSGLHYMTSSPNDVGTGDFATFTFVGSSYSSQYIAFRPYEAYDRSRNPLQTVPSNYSALWSSKASGGVPFLNFGNSYIAATSVLADPTILTGRNWTSIITGISTSDGVGIQIREAANLITAVICKLTQGSPASVCSASPIGSETSSIAAPYAAGLTAVPPQSFVLPAQVPEPYFRRLA